MIKTTTSEDAGLRSEFNFYLKLEIIVATWAVLFNDWTVLTSTPSRLAPWLAGRNLEASYMFPMQESTPCISEVWIWTEVSAPSSRDSAWNMRLSLAFAKGCLERPALFRRVIAKTSQIWLEFFGLAFIRCPAAKPWNRETNDANSSFFFLFQDFTLSKE